MAYHFVIKKPPLPPLAERLDFIFDEDPYTPPDGDGVDFIFDEE